MIFFVDFVFVLVRIEGNPFKHSLVFYSIRVFVGTPVISEIVSYIRQWHQHFLLFGLYGILTVGQGYYMLIFSTVI